eukprot:CAMPEP_0119053640 /NCGR_PEP_ID=MMETSP1177-20130426/74551_1 /TAXON_ID=2985 /ORGANISM="Ochromonas sp, Strain CCMP1899" /LENGTH=107 /DNA_ID=CAMNT_0007033641 /DNA_START=143 /DNA_END=463 /DNA_ORIENTATION=-
MSNTQDYIDYLFPGPIFVNASENLHDDNDISKDYDSEDDCHSLKQKSKTVYFLNPFDISNTAFVTSYFNVGIAMSLLDIPVSYFLIKTLRKSATQVSAFKSLMGLPW